MEATSQLIIQHKKILLELQRDREKKSSESASVSVSGPAAVDQENVPVTPAVSVPPILKDETPKPSVAVTRDKVDSHSLRNVTNTDSGNITITTTMDSNNDNSYRQYGGENCPLLQQETLLTTDNTGRPERGVPGPATVAEENVPDAPVVPVLPILKEETSKPSVTVNCIGGDKVDVHFDSSNVTNKNSGNITITTTTGSNNDNSYRHYGARGENCPLLQQETLDDYTGRPERRSVRRKRRKKIGGSVASSNLRS